MLMLYLVSKIPSQAYLFLIWVYRWTPPSYFACPPLPPKFPTQLSFHSQREPRFIIYLNIAYLTFQSELKCWKSIIASCNSANLFFIGSFWNVLGTAKPLVCQYLHSIQRAVYWWGKGTSDNADILGNLRKVEQGETWKTFNFFKMERNCYLLYFKLSLSLSPSSLFFSLL